MQYNDIISLKKANSKSRFSFLIKSFIFLGLSCYIFYVVYDKIGSEKSYSIFIYEVYNKHGWLLFIPIVLFPFNWGIEAVKWRYLTRKIEKISFLRACRGILTGVTLGFATPLGLGDYAGRILQLNSTDRAKSFGAVFTSRILQLYITLICGCMSVFFLFSKDGEGWYFIMMVLGINLIFILALIFHKQILWKFKKIRALNKIYPYFEIISQYEFKELSFALWLSFIRYLIFSTQFILILYFAEVSNNIGLLFMGVNFIFLMKSIIPTLFELGVREWAALFFFGMTIGAHDVHHTLSHYPDEGKILFSSLSLWLINILMPAIIGLCFIFKLKFFTKP